MPIHTAAIRAFLTKWETSQTVGYIPCRKRNFTGCNDLAACGEVIASSGVTIGTGLDLGQQREADLERMGVPAALIARFRPYLCKKREQAVFALQRAPLTISDDECAALDEAVHTDYICRAARVYDRATGFRFEDIPAEVQTVIVSLFYQIGNPYGHPGYRKTWGFLCEGDWAAAAHELATGFTQYTHRRTDEARLLRRMLHGQTTTR